MKFNKLALTMLLASSALSMNSAMAAQLDSSFNVKLAITPLCQIKTINDVDFGIVDASTATKIENTTLSVTCNKNQAYKIALKPSNGDPDGKGEMKGAANPTELIAYTMHSDAAATAAWGVNTTVDDTGDSNVKNHVVYVKVEGTEFGKPADNYLDVVGVAITY